MQKEYNEVGSLLEIKKQLYSHNISDFNSVKELIEFRENYTFYRNKIIEKHKHIIELEKSDSILQLSTLKNALIDKENKIQSISCSQKNYLKSNSESKNLLKKFIRCFKNIVLELRIKWANKKIKLKLSREISLLKREVLKKETRLSKIDTNHYQVILDSASNELIQIEKKNNLIRDLNPVILGALGEKRVVKELRLLSVDYVLINNFNFIFEKYVYYSQQNEYIKSIQIDHLLITRSGIYVIETKNWSQNSINSYNLRSPVSQVKRSGFAIFNLITEDSSVIFQNHHWGDRKIPVRNIIILTQKKLLEEFQYVKILSIKDVCKYIEFFEPTMSTREMELLSNYFIARCKN